MIITGKCHCGNISFVLGWEPEAAEIPARACTCSFCAKHGGVWTACAGGSLKVRVAEPSSVSRYAFATGTASFHICTRCGVVPVATSEIESRLYAVVSARAFEDVDPSLLRPESISFDGESERDRLGRRARNWIGNVEFIEAAIRPQHC